MPTTTTAPPVPVRTIASDLHRSVQTAIQATPTRAAFPALTGVRLTVTAGVLHVQGTDLDLWVTAHNEADTGEERFDVVVDGARLFANALKAAGDAILDLVVDQDEASLTLAGADGFEAVFRLHDLADWPKLPTFGDTGDQFTCPAFPVKDAWRRLKPAASVDLTGSQVITGVHLSAPERGDGQVATTTDKYRLANVTLPDPIGPADAIVPPRVLDLAVKAARDDEDLTFCWEEHTVWMHGSAFTVAARRIPGGYPDWRNLCAPAGPGLEWTVTVDPARMAAAVRRIGMFAETSLTSCRITPDVAGGRLLMQVGHQAKAHVPARFGGAMDLAVEVGFNPEFLADALETCPGTACTITLRDAVKLATLTGDVDGWAHRLMPIRT